MRIACGVFDGVHRGHQALLSQKPDVVYVLPSPSKLVLTTAEEKLALLAAYAGSTAHIEFVDQLPGCSSSEVLSIEPVLYDYLPISGERIRSALLAGRIEEAEAMLGYPYQCH